MNDDETYVALSAPFEHVQMRNNLAYLDGEQVVSRLNDVLGWQGWNFRILEHGVADDDLWALGELTVQLEIPVIRQQFGSQKHQRNEYGDDLKGAATDALKKCASLIGVGLYLREEGNGATQPRSEPTIATSGRPTAAPPPKAASSDRMTQAQEAGIFARGRNMEWSKETTMTKVEEWLGAAFETMTKNEASRAIDWLDEVKARAVPSRS